MLAKWLATGPKVLLLDEPTRGIDINAKKEIYAIIDELARSGLGVVMVSSELPEILAIADRILVLAEGRLTGGIPARRSDRRSDSQGGTARGERAAGEDRMTSSNAREHFARFQSLLALALMVVALSLASDKFLTRRQRPQRAAADLDQSLPVDRHDDGHPVGRHRSVGRLGAGAVGCRGGRIAQKRHSPLPYSDVALQFTVFGRDRGRRAGRPAARLVQRLRRSRASGCRRSWPRSACSALPAG